MGTVLTVAREWGRVLRMTTAEKIVVSAYTGYLMCDFDLMHQYIEKVMGRPVYVHELDSEAFNHELMEKVKPDFLKICAGEEVHLHLRNRKRLSRKRNRLI